LTTWDVRATLFSEESSTMADQTMKATDRRTFLQTGAIASAAALGRSPGARADEPAADKPETLPTRPLGKTGVKVTILDQGAVRGSAYDRILRQAFASGVRVFDTAKVYGTEPNLRKWFAQSPEIRKEIFLVTKDSPRQPRQMLEMVDQRLESLGTDHIDLFFIHGLGDEHSLDEAVNLVKSQEFKETADAIRKSGKAKFIGFSTHHKDRAQIIQAAADAGIVDAIMLQYTPWLDKDAPLNRALDACWKKGIGLISMKQVAGKQFGDQSGGNVLEKVAERVPMLKEKGLSPFQGLLHAIWTDERISSCCVSMRNTDQLRQNVEAAQRFEPLKTAEIHQLRDAVLAFGQTLCADCDGRCSAAAGTTAELGNLTRFLTYHDHLGDRAEARRQYAALSAEARDWSGADLDAARAACPGQLDFARLLPEVDRRLA
jgi:predicted aldo/keto reductase-like oxidoreductase